MKAIVRHRYGSTDVLELQEIDKPVVTHEGVLVRVHATSLNSGDLDYLHGRPLIARIGTGLRKPRNRGLGFDVAGHVEAVGEGVTELRPGDEVFGDLTQYGLGAFAEYVCAPARAFALKPARMTFEESATVPQSAVLALQGLRGKRRIQPGDRVLINGAGGCVGPFAVQIAKTLGAEVTGVDNTSKLDMLRSIGADHVIDYTREDFSRNGQRYDYVLDLVARRSMFDCRRALNPRGVYVLEGGSAGPVLQAALLGPLSSITGSKRIGVMWWWKPFQQEDVELLKELIEAGSVVAVIDRRYALSDVPEAFRYLEEGLARGKVVITV